MHLEEQVSSVLPIVSDVLTRCDTSAHNFRTSRRLYLRAGTCGLGIVNSVGSLLHQLHSSSPAHDQSLGNPLSLTHLLWVIHLILRKAGFASEFQGLQSQMRLISILIETNEPSISDSGIWLLGGKLSNIFLRI